MRTVILDYPRRRLPGSAKPEIRSYRWPRHPGRSDGTYRPVAGRLPQRAVTALATNVPGPRAPLKVMGRNRRGRTARGVEVAVARLVAGSKRRQPIRGERGLSLVVNS